MENHTRAITFATLTAVLFATACVSRSSNQNNLPAISADNTPFIRITELARMDLEVAAIVKRPTPTTEAVENLVKRQRVIGTETLDKGDLYIPDLIDRKEPGSIVTVNSGVEEWALIRTSLWDEQRNKAFVTPGLIPLYEYKQHLASSRKAGKKNDTQH